MRGWVRIVMQQLVRGTIRYEIDYDDGDGLISTLCSWPHPVECSYHLFRFSA